MNTPAPPAEGISSGASPVEPSSGGDAPSAAALKLRAIKIGKVTLDDIWLAASGEASRAETSGQLHVQYAERSEPGSEKAKLHAQIAAARFGARDCFFAMCRLIDRIKVSPKIKTEIRDLADREAEDLQALVADYLRDIAPRDASQSEESETAAQ